MSFGPIQQVPLSFVPTIEKKVQRVCVICHDYEMNIHYYCYIIQHQLFKNS